MWWGKVGLGDPGGWGCLWLDIKKCSMSLFTWCGTSFYSGVGSQPAWLRFEGWGGWAFKPSWDGGVVSAEMTNRKDIGPPPSAHRGKVKVRLIGTAFSVPSGGPGQGCQCPACAQTSHHTTWAKAKSSQGEEFRPDYFWEAAESHCHRK